MQRGGYTFVEVLIVLVALAILAGLVLPMYQDMQVRTIRAVLQENLRQMQQQVDYHRSIGNGSPPETIEPEWFAEGELPPHPQNKWPDHLLPDLDVVDSDQLHPDDKVLKPPNREASNRAPYWYNSRLGIVRARVAKVPGPWPNTLELYNEVNGSSVTDLGNLGQGGGNPGGGQDQGSGNY